MANIGYRFYYLFCIANFTNAVFFYLLLPEVTTLTISARIQPADT